HLHAYGSSSMARVEVIMPQMGESITEGTVVRGRKGVGEAKGGDDGVRGIATDKVDAELPSPAHGVLAAVVVPPGKTVAVGTVIALIETDASVGASGGAAASAGASGGAEAAAGAVKTASGVGQGKASGATVDVIMPQMGESITEGTVV